MSGADAFRSSQWIWPVERFHTLRNVHACFRRDFEIDAVPESVPFAITADQRFQLFINGRYVGRGPARGFQESWPFDEFDIAPFLKPGHNFISVRAYNGGVGTFQYRHDAWAGFLCAGRIGDVSLASGPEWKSRPCPAHNRDTAKLSWQLDFQEWFDARLDDESWISDPEADLSHWHGAGGLPYGHQPWQDTEPRGIPHLTSTRVSYERVASRGSAAVAPGWLASHNMFHPLHAELPSAVFQPAEGSGSEPLLIEASGKGRWSGVLLDLGRPGFGHLELEAEGDEGAVLDVFFAEGATPELSPSIGVEVTMACEASMVSRLVLGKGTTRHSFFHPIGHRFLLLFARETSSPIRVRASLMETLYPLETDGVLETDNPVLNDILRICRQTQRVCMMDAYVDTGWREQAQWWGDARVQAQNTFFLSADDRLLARGIRQIGTQQLKNGLTYGHAPTTAHNCVLPDFTLTWLLTIYDHWRQTGSTELLVELLPRVEKVLDYFEGEGMGANGLPRFDPRYWLFLDWCDIHRSGSPGLLALLLVLAAQSLAEVSDEAGLDALSSRLRRLSSSVAGQAEALLWSEAKGLFCDGVDDAGKPVDRCSIQLQTLAILAGLKPDHHASMAEARLIPHVKGQPVDSAEPSSFWVSYVLDALEHIGRTESIVDFIHTKWSPMIPYEGTWEGFPPSDPAALRAQIGSGSMTHAWSAHPIFHLARVLGGVRQKAPAWREVWFRPLLAEPSTAKVRCVVPTPHGPIRSEWRREAGRAKVSLSLPKGIAAWVWLPGVEETVEGEREWTCALPPSEAD